MDEIEALAKEMFTDWQVTKREKALVWEDLASSATGVLDDGWTLRYNFMRKAVQKVYGNMTSVPTGETDYGYSFRDADKKLHVVFSKYGGGWSKRSADILSTMDPDALAEGITRVEVVAREWGGPHAHSGR